jgi:hypothetical protein
METEKFGGAEQALAIPKFQIIYSLQLGFSEHSSGNV